MVSGPVPHVDDRISDDRSRGPVDPTESEPTPPNITIDDPRPDPISLAWALGQLDRGRFVDGYSRLVRLAGNPRRIGRFARSDGSAPGRGVAEQLSEIVISPEWDGRAPRFSGQPRIPIWQKPLCSF